VEHVAAGPGHLAGGRELNVATTFGENEPWLPSTNPLNTNPWLPPSGGRKSNEGTMRARVTIIWLPSTPR
jgi:hypothetical protein